MDFADFINSKDIREYHKKIGYEYNSLEAAWLVSQCRRLTLEERHDAWQWIIDNMPDQIVKNRRERKHKFTEEEYYMDSIFFTSDMCLDLADFEKMIDGHFYDFTLA